MKGTGASFGFQFITDIGGALEREAMGANADADLSRKWVGELATYLRPMGSKVPSIYGGSYDEPFQPPASKTTAA
jgi:hypothetical protein